jgi:hypothetical protein
VSRLNSRLDELHAAILSRSMLPRLAGWTARRREIAAKYLEAIRNPQIVMPRIRKEMNPCWHLFPVRVEETRREAFMNHMSNRGIATGIHYPRLIPNQPALKGHELEILGPLATAERVCRSEVSLPIHPHHLRVGSPETLAARGAAPRLPQIPSPPCSLISTQPPVSLMLAQRAAMNRQRGDFHRDWNYAIFPTRNKRSTRYSDATPY